MNLNFLEPIAKLLEEKKKEKAAAQLVREVTQTNDDHALYSQLTALSEKYTIALPGKFYYIINGRDGDAEFCKNVEVVFSRNGSTMVSKSSVDSDIDVDKIRSLQRAGSYAEVKEDKGQEVYSAGFVPERAVLEKLKEAASTSPVALEQAIREMAQPRLPLSTLESNVIDLYNTYLSYERHNNFTIRYGFNENYILSATDIQKTIADIKAKDPELTHTKEHLTALTAQLCNRATVAFARRDGYQASTFVATPTTEQLATLEAEVYLRKTLGFFIEDTLGDVIVGTKNASAQITNPEAAPIMASIGKVIKEVDPRLKNVDAFIAPLKEATIAYAEKNKVLAATLGNTMSSEMRVLNFNNQLAAKIYEIAEQRSMELTTEAPVM